MQAAQKRDVEVEHSHRCSDNESKALVWDYFKLTLCADYWQTREGRPGEQEQRDRSDEKREFNPLRRDRFIHAEEHFTSLRLNVLIPCFLEVSFDKVLFCIGAYSFARGFLPDATVRFEECSPEEGSLLQTLRWLIVLELKWRDCRHDPWSWKSEERFRLDCEHVDENNYRPLN